MVMSDNKAFVLTAFDTLFNQRDYETAATFWSPDYLQHSAHIPPGRDGLFNLVRAAPREMRYDNHVAVADGDYVLLHGRFTGNGRPRASSFPVRCSGCTSASTRDGRCSRRFVIGAPF